MKMTKAQAKEEFAREMFYMPTRDRTDKAAIRQAWNEFVDMLVRNGHITEAQANRWVKPVRSARQNPSRRRNPSRDNNWRKRQIILDRKLVDRLYDWQGGQGDPLYALASTGSEDLVSLSMIDAGLSSLNLAMGDLKKKKRTNKLRHDLRNTIGDLELVRHYWKENTAKEAGMGLEEDEYEYDHRDYGTTEEEEREMGR